MGHTTPHRQPEESAPFDRSDAFKLALRAWKWGFGLSAGLALLNFLGGPKIALTAGAWDYLALWLENTAEVATLILPMTVSAIIEMHSPGLFLMAHLRLYFLVTLVGCPLLVLAHGSLGVLPPALWNLALCTGWPLYAYYQHRTDLKTGDNSKSNSYPINREKRLTMGNTFAVLGYLAVFLLAIAGMVFATYSTQQYFKSVPWSFSDFSGSIGGGIGGGIGALMANLGSLLKKNFKGEAPLKLIGLFAGMLSIMALGLYAAGIHVFRQQGPILWYLIGLVVVATLIFSMSIKGNALHAEKGE